MCLYFLHKVCNEFAVVCNTKRHLDEFDKSDQSSQEVLFNTKTFENLRHFNENILIKTSITVRLICCGGSRLETYVKICVYAPL